MSTHFDGVNSTKVECDLDSLEALGSIDTIGLALAFLWRPLAVEASGLFKHAFNSPNSNPYLDGRIYYTYAGGNFVHSGQGSAAGKAGEFYTATDGWRIDIFENRLNLTKFDVYRHTYFYSSGVWTHTLINGGFTSISSGYSAPGRFGSFTDTESGQQNLAAIAAWGGTGSNSGSKSDSAWEGMEAGLYAWAALSPAALWSFEDATTKTIDPLSQGNEKTTVSSGVTHVTDEPAGWTYSLTPPSSAGLLQVRASGILVPSLSVGVARVGGTAYPFDGS